MQFLTSWLWWITLVFIGVVGYVQDVGKQFERASGLKRISNLELYRYLFRGLPWIIFWRGGFIRLALLFFVLVWWGWKAAVASVVALFIISFLLMFVSRRHAHTMLTQCAADDFGGTHRLCVSCNRVSPIGYFGLDSQGKNGHVTTCVGCPHSKRNKSNGRSARHGVPTWKA